MAAYRTATRLFPGCHLPVVCIGMEYRRANNLRYGRARVSQIRHTLFAHCPPVITVYYIRHKCTVLPKLVTVCPYIAIYILLGATQD